MCKLSEGVGVLMVTVIAFLHLSQAKKKAKIVPTLIFQFFRLHRGLYNSYHLLFL